jgi:hypothetical protein
LGLACCLGLSAAGGDPATYTQGTVKGLPLQAQGRIELDGQNLIFHHGSNHLMVPYQNITAVDVDIPGGGKEPVYKVWKLHRRLGSDSSLRRLTVRFVAEPDVVKMMVFTMAPEHAAHVQRSLQPATAKSFDKKPEMGEVKNVYREEWWGDSMWKTTRNAAKWPDNRPAGGSGNER